jgi:hypothetical protein
MRDGDCLSMLRLSRVTVGDTIPGWEYINISAFCTHGDRMTYNDDKSELLLLLLRTSFSSCTVNPPKQSRNCGQGRRSDEYFCESGTLYWVRCRTWPRLYRTTLYDGDVMSRDETAAERLLSLLVLAFYSWFTNCFECIVTKFPGRCHISFKTSRRCVNKTENLSVLSKTDGQIS